ncbi:hypothetical protein ACIBCN_20005 [Nocardia sp. NPDC051052]|uniref:hypothetical protein n=1 Tax=Nocardia sp. NPDC051052 TaxID=3364322 RepID=UPI00378774A5
MTALTGFMTGESFGVVDATESGSCGPASTDRGAESYACTKVLACSVKPRRASIRSSIRAAEYGFIPSKV